MTLKTARTIEELSNCTVYLNRDSIEGLAITGTACLIQHNGKFYLVTAAHVAKDMDEKTYIVFRLENDQPLILELASFLPDKKVTWKNHSIEDISIIELLPYDSVTEFRFNTFAFPSNLILGSLTRLPDDLRITMMGYPILDLDFKYFSPIYIHCGPSSGYLTSQRSDTKTNATFLYLDKPSIQGMSGGPVFISALIPMVMGMGKTVLVGIIHGTFFDDTGGKLAAISPAYYPWELLNSI